MNIDDCIEVCEGIKAGKNFQFTEIGMQNWRPKNKDSLPNFIIFDYRIAPDVVYKIVDDGVVYHNALKPALPSSTCVVTKGYWVEGDPA